MTNDPEVVKDVNPEKQLKPARATESPSRSPSNIRNFEDLIRTATAAFRSHMLPKDVQNIDMAFWIIYNGLDLGIPASQAFRYLYLTKGRRIAMTTEGKQAMIYKSGLCQGYREWIEGEGESMVAMATTRRKGFTDPFTKEFSWQDAKEAGLLEQKTNRQGDEYDSTYQKYLKDMLLARARERVFKIAFPDVTGGLASEGIAEEIERNEALGREPIPVEPGEAEPTRALPPAGPDPLLEALRPKKPKQEPIPVKAEVVQPPEPEPPEEEEAESGELFG